MFIQWRVKEKKHDPQNNFLSLRLNDEARKLFSDLGSSYASQMGFRDNWIFLGGSGLKSKSPFEQVCCGNSSWVL